MDAPAVLTDALPADAAEHQVQLSLPATAEAADAAGLPVHPPAVQRGQQKGAAECRGITIVITDVTVDAAKNKLMKI